MQEECDQAAKEAEEREEHHEAGTTGIYPQALHQEKPYLP